MVGRMLKSLKKAQGRKINSVHSQLPLMKIPKNDEPDIFGIRQPHEDLLVITLRVEEFNIHRILIDNGSSANIIYLPMF